MTQSKNLSVLLGGFAVKSAPIEDGRDATLQTMVRLIQQVDFNRFRALVVGHRRIDTGRIKADGPFIGTTRGYFVDLAFRPAALIVGDKILTFFEAGGYIACDPDGKTLSSEEIEAEIARKEEESKLFDDIYTGKL